MVRVFAGPGAADRIQGLLLFGTSLVAILLLMAYAVERRALVDVALVTALLAAWLSIAFVTTSGRAERTRDR